MNVGATNAPMLVVGYGNALRGDDAVGCRVAELLAGDTRLRGVRIEARHQLTPELAADIAASELVVLIDAAQGEASPGEVRVEPVVGRGQSRAFGGSHACDAPAIVDLAERVYGRAAAVVLVHVAGQCFEPGFDLSPAVAAALPIAVDTVVAIAADVRPAISPADRVRSRQYPQPSWLEGGRASR
jgi:hydrogenase maturation protease